jgi:hypothetical protein
VNWIKWVLAGNALQPVWVESLAVQARWLRRHIEWHLLGNHLFVNAKALVFAGLFFEGEEAAEWLAQGLKILRREVPEQVLADGGHFELSPMYHAIILEDLLDLLNAVGAWPGQVSEVVVAQWREVGGEDAALVCRDDSSGWENCILQRRGIRYCAGPCGACCVCGAAGACGCRESR